MTSKKEFKKPHGNPCGSILFCMHPEIYISLRRHYPYQVKGFGHYHLSLSAPLISMRFYGVILAHRPLFVNSFTKYFYCKYLALSQSAAPITVANCESSGIIKFTPNFSSRPENVLVIDLSEVRFPVSTTFLIP